MGRLQSSRNHPALRPPSLRDSGRVAGRAEAGAGSARRVRPVCPVASALGAGLPGLVSRQGSAPVRGGVEGVAVAGAVGVATYVLPCWPCSPRSPATAMRS